MKNIKVFFSMILIITIVSAFVGCTNREDKDVANSNQQNNDANDSTKINESLSGTVIVDGSGTVYPLMAHIAEEYMTKIQPKVSVQVGRAGSSAGFKKFIQGETDFSNASRKIKDDEVAELKAKGLEMGKDILEFKLAYDGLTMVINKNNTWAKQMTKEEVIKMFLSGAYNGDDKILWSDIRPEWPAQEIKFFGPNENHGTYEFFYETILGKQEIVKTANLQQEYSTLVDLVSRDENAIAFFGFGYYVNNQNKITAVEIDFGSGPVAPSLETIGEDLDYAGFTRPVFTYLNLQHAKGKPELFDFAKFIVSEGASRLAGENGFAPMPESVYAEYQKQLENIK